MWRYWVGAVAALLFAGGAFFLFRGPAASEAAAPLPAAPAAQGTAGAGEPLPDTVPRAPDRTREQKRFDRYDKDRNDSITREEFLTPRRKAFAKLDKDGDGKLGFEEWAVRTTDRFAEADRDKSGAMNRAEFATTAPKRKAPAARAKCDCGKTAPRAAPEDEGEE